MRKVSNEQSVYKIYDFNFVIKQNWLVETEVVKTIVEYSGILNDKIIKVKVKNMNMYFNGVFIIVIIIK